jgi:hypothetical protein
VTFEADVFLERRASLELAIGRALARCASPSGYRVLITYLDDTRALLAEHAHDELVAITGQDFGKDAAAWTRWLAAAGGALAPRPMLERFDLPAQADVVLRDPSETAALAVAP